ncbi:MAG: Ig-like domain-containing protein [Lachnospiraceae bacterium]|nr:Ig-like domain-containing protein [Lachnospiraceae bacterium]
MKLKGKILKAITAFAIAGVMIMSMLAPATVSKAASMNGAGAVAVPIDEAHFPDRIFRLVLQEEFDKDKDNILSVAEINAIVSVDVHGTNVTDVTGIEYFVNLEELNCSDPIKYSMKMDVSKNPKLKVLKCGHKNLTEIDVSNNTELIELYVTGCDELTELDVTNCPKLEILSAAMNNLTEIDLSNNPKLKELDLSRNMTLTKIDLTNNPELVELDLEMTGITEIDLSKNIKLNYLYLEECQLKELDVSNNINLKTLDCVFNNLTELDVSKNIQLTELEFGYGYIEIINVSNNVNLDEDNIYWYSPYVDCKVIYNSVKSITLNKTSVNLEKGKTTTLTATVAPADADMKTVLWSSSNPEVATVDATGKVTAVGIGKATITATAEDRSGVKATCNIIVPSQTSTTPTNPNIPSTPQLTSPSGINVYYRTHIQTYGWEGVKGDESTWRANGNMSGTSGKSKRLEGINIVVNPKTTGSYVDLGVQYTTHCQSYGWLPWSANGEMNGTEGESKRLEAIKIQLTGTDKDKYDIYYRVHAQTYGWLGWAKNGAPAGTAGYAKRLEGIQIVVVKKGESFNQKMEGITSAKTEAFVAKAGNSPIVNYPATSNTNPVVPGADTVNVAYRTHVQSYGWQAWKYNGQMSGTSGQAKRLEGINIELRNQAYSGDIVYTTHVQKYGWQGKLEDQSTWKKNGEMSGTSGEAKRLEAICINLTGDMAAKYDIYYRVHAQSYGWLGWAKNGAPAGTAGYAKRLEGIQIVLVPKGGANPGNYQGITSVRTEAYVKK